MDGIKGIDDLLVLGKKPKALKNSQTKELKEQLENDYGFVNKEEKPATYYELANQFLRETKNKYIYYRDEFYFYKGGVYELVPDNELKAIILKWAQSIFEYWGKAKRNFVNEIFSHIQAICYVKGKRQIPFMLDSEEETNSLLVVRNGILDMEKVLNNEPKVLLEHTSNYFCLAKLDVEYNPNVNVPKTFFNYLERVQPKDHMRKLLQEWFGYNLVFDTTYEKMMFFLGEGANGKSVFLAVMKALLGKENFSTVDLEGFKPTSRFALANTHGKLANIVGDLNEVDKIGEGVLKQYVTGEEMQVEKKFKTPFMMKPTAKLTYSMNNPPDFHDGSKGIWRRIILIKWKVEIPEGERDKNLLKEKYWIKSGEMSGILNWAIDGLIRLRMQDRFTSSQELISDLEEYALASNPTKEFLIDRLEESEGSQISTYQLYNSYALHMESLGHRPIASNKFPQEVRRLFKKAYITKNAVTQPLDNRRCRNWVNIRFSK